MKRMVLCIFLLVGCQSEQEEMQERLGELVAMPAATTLEAAKAAVDSANNFVRWLDAHPEDASPGLLEQAKDLRNRRVRELADLGGDRVTEKAKEIFGSLGLPPLDIGGKFGRAIDGTYVDRLQKWLGPMRDTAITTTTTNQ